MTDLPSDAECEDGSRAVAPQGRQRTPRWSADAAWPWSMKIVLITPEGPTSRTGNRVAATRWARILRRLGHRVRVASDYDGRPADAMVAVHAWRSAAAIERFKAAIPERPVILQLSGTDIYQFIDTDPVPTLRSMELADRLVALNDLAWRAVPKRLRARLSVIHQSAPPLARPRRPSRRRRRGLGDRPSARREGSPARRGSGAPAAGRQPHPHRAGRPRLYAGVGRACPRRDGRQRALPMAGRRAGRRRAPAAGAQPRHGHLLAERGRRQRGLGGRRRRRAGAGVAHGRQCRPARRRLSRLLPGRRHQGARAAACSGWSASRASSRRLGKALARRAPLFRPAREIAAWRRLLADIA